MPKRARKVTSPPKLPHELFLQILSDKSLSSSDLAALALVSRRFLAPVRLCLYESVPIELVEVWNAQDELDQTFYDLPSWQLLRATVDNPELAALITGLDFQLARWKLFNEETEKPSVGIATTAKVALAEFFRLVPNVNTVSAMEYEGYTNLLGAFSDFKNHGQIVKLELHSMIPAQGVRISEDLVNLRHLKLEKVEEEFLRPSIFERLDSLDIVDPTTRLRRIPLLTSNTCNLRELRINVEFLIELGDLIDLPKFPRLDTLHVYDAPCPDEINDDEVQRRINRFWTLVQDQVPKLRTLSFQGDRFGDYEDWIFDPGLRMPRIRTLETIRFEDEVSVDRIAAMLDWPLLKAVPRLVLSLNSVYWQVNLRRRKIDAISSMCEDNGIEIMLSD